MERRQFFVNQFATIPYEIRDLFIEPITVPTNQPLPTAYCLLPTAYCLLPTAYCLLTTDH
jgi:hypothetical protein